MKSCQDKHIEIIWAEEYLKCPLCNERELIMKDRIGYSAEIAMLRHKLLNLNKPTSAVGNTARE